MAYDPAPASPPPDVQAIIDGIDPDRLDGLPKEYELRRDGVWCPFERAPRSADTEAGENAAPPELKWLCSPLRVRAMPRDADGRGWSRLIEVTDPDGKVHRWAMPAALLAGDGREVLAELMGMGFRLVHRPGARGKLLTLLDGWRPDARLRTTDRLGWADASCSAFVLGDGRVLGDPGFVFLRDAGQSAAAEMTARGSLEDWRRGVAAPCVGNPLLLVCVSLAFAGPLLEPLNMDGGGVHLRGASSRGKSTLQRAAVSVWGNERFLHTWRATANGLEGVAAACNGTLLALDEMGEIDGREAGAAAYMLGNGQGKARASRSGAARSATRWKVMILSSGEIALADKVAEAGRREQAGQAVRLLDIAADGRTHGAFDELHGAGDAAAFADRLRQAAALAHGVAGPAFVSALLSDREACLAAVRAAMMTFMEEAAARFELPGEGQTVRAIRRFALIAAAGELATAQGLTGWPEGAAARAALDVLGIWLAGRRGSGSHEAAAAIERVRAFLLAHGASRFEAWPGGDAEPSPVRIVDRAGWRRGDVFYIGADAWRTLHAGADAARAARCLRDAGWLEPGEGKNLARKGPASAGGARCYVVRAAILGAGDE